MEFAFLSPSPMELAVIAVIALLVLGPSRLPEAARALGKGMREMRDSFQNAADDDDDDGTRIDDDGADFDEDPDLYAPGDEIDEDPEDDDDGSVGAEPTAKTAPAAGGTTTA